MARALCARHGARNRFYRQCFRESGAPELQPEADSEPPAHDRLKTQAAKSPREPERTKGK